MIRVEMELLVLDEEHILDRQRVHHPVTSSSPNRVLGFQDNHRALWLTKLWWMYCDRFLL
jgi:hypothetical protein